MQHLQPNTTLQGGKYRIERVLGQGGFGNTYVGYNTEFEETVAIKEFFMKGVTERDETTSVVSVSNADNVKQFEEQREKFKKEARRLRKLKNEHIVKVHDLFEENGTAYYVMDFIDGESLAEKMKKTGQPFTEVEVRSILSQILEALKEVHQNEIWHLDLKPGNIMIDKSGNAYLIDFGASKQIRANGSMTTSTALCYTPGYAPTEQIGQMYDRFGPWTDIYALGATVYNLLTNKKPPMGMDIEEDEEDAFDFPTTVSGDMRKLVIWMMQPKRKSRPQNVDVLIDKMKAGETTKEESIVVPESEPKPEPEPAPESEETLLIGTSGIQDKQNKIMTLTIDKNNDKISNTKFVWDDNKMVYKLSFDYAFNCNSGLDLHYELTINEVSLYHDRTDGHSFLSWNGHDVYEFYDDDTIFEEELDDSELDKLDDEESDVYYAQSYDDYAESMMGEFLEDGVPDDIIFNIVDIYGYDSSIPNQKVSFFKKMIAKIGGDREADLVQITRNEQSRQD